MDVLKVSASTDPSKLSGAVSAAIRGSGEVAVTAMGAQAVFNAVRGIAIARGRALVEGSDFDVKFMFRPLRLDGGDRERSAIKFVVKKVDAAAE
ncbi:stage V sporulation protein S [Neomoorella thermoacetica]|uniref:stage V sporulation protein S n=1 Tax=Neomoorella thermoacetica TaxID=1525 RepID=UPI0030D2995F